MKHCVNVAKWNPNLGLSHFKQLPEKIKLSEENKI
jgi:hypothetical protein